MFDNYSVDETRRIITIFGKLIGWYLGLVIKMVAIAWAIAWGIHLASTL